MLKVFRALYLATRFFYGLCALVLLFCCAFFWSFLLYPMFFVLLCFAAIVIIDMIWLFYKRILIQGQRNTQPLFSLADNNKVEITIRNLSNNFWNLEIIDELPTQLQLRDFAIKTKIKPLANEVLSYFIKPLSRGEYHFGKLNIYASTRLNLVKRRIEIPVAQMVPVYPSIIQMKKFELYTMSKITRLHGIKKMRRIGLSYEFEQIKDYVRGDDVRQINWKSTGRNQRIMINQYEDEKSQPIYTIIDKSRIMLMPFNGLSLMDYAINASLVISNVALKKQDKVGLITFSDKIGSAIKADRKQGQLQSILNALYHQKERDFEANYELLYFGIKNLIKTRSLVFLYANFESQYGLDRVLPILRSINKQHLLIVVYFENTELENESIKEVNSLKGIYSQAIVLQTLNEKKAIAQKLNNIGIQTILTKPEDLTINSVNKYLEIKSRGLI